MRKAPYPSRPKQGKDTIVQMLDCLDDRKISDAYRFLRHLSTGSELKGEGNIEE